MAKSMSERLNSLELSAEDVRKNNPMWTEKMVLDYVGISQGLRMIAEAVDAMTNQEVSVQYAGEVDDELSLESVNEDEPSLHIDMAKESSDVLDLFQTPKEERSAYVNLTGNFNQPVAAGSEVIVSGLTIESSGEISATSSTVTVKDDGVYLIAVSQTEDASPSAMITVVIKVNGVDVAQYEQDITAGSEIRASNILQKRLKVGDTVAAYVSHDQGGSVTIDLQNIIFTVGK